MSAIAPAINKATVLFAGLSIAGGAAGAAMAGGGGASAAAMQLSRTFVGRAILPVVTGAIAKAEKYAEQLDMSPTELVNKTLTLGTQLVDNLERDAGNINNIMARPDGVSGFVRVTTDPTASKVISVGLMTANQVANGIVSGRFTPIQ